MFFLDKFWKGDVAPGEGRYHPRPEYSKALHIMETAKVSYTLLKLIGYEVRRVSKDSKKPGYHRWRYHLTESLQLAS